MPRFMPALNVFFNNRKTRVSDVWTYSSKKSDYSIWFAVQQTSYTVVRDAFVAADSALENAVQAYNIQRNVCDAQYCDWKNEWEAVCVAFDKCVTDASKFYTKTLVPRLTAV